MTRIRTIFVILAIIAWAIRATGAAAQETPVDTDADLPARVDTLQVVGPGPFIIRPFIRRGTLTIRSGDTEVPSSAWEADYRHGLITFKDVHADSSFVFVASYRYLPLEEAGRITLWPRAAPGGETDRGAGRGEAVPRRTVDAASGLRRSGSITRGVHAGSGRDASIESGLRLELSGEVAPGVAVRASLSDEDTPILPEGTTRRLDQFDRVFIGLSARPGTLTLGDITATIESGRFARLSRKLQGVSATSNPIDLGGSGRLGAVTAGGASVRGRFRVQRIDALEGVQGPYRLRGDGGETFILVLPGTERVYLDGVLMTRGQPNDYVIDYTTAEITFTNRRIIGADRRIRVEFEYTTQQFSRTMLFADATAGVGRTATGDSRFELGVTAIREADGDQFSEEFGFSAADSAAVRMAGDDEVLRSGATRVEYDPEALFTQYVIEQRAVAGDTVDVFVPVTARPDEERPVYRVSFTRLGPGRGSYVRSGSDVNGVVYTFVGPGEGTYDPVRRLPTPLRRQLLDVRTVVRPLRNLEIRAETGASGVDRNLISSLDDGNNDGQALLLEAEWDSPVLRYADADVGRLTLDGEFRSRSANFETFDRVRSIEFEREWNLRGRSSEAGRNAIPGELERESSIEAGLSRADSTGLSVRLARLELGNVYEGDRKVGVVRWMSAGPRITYRLDRVVTRDSLAGGREAWARHVGRIGRGDVKAALQPFVEVEAEEFTGDETTFVDPDDPDDPQAGVLESRNFVEVRAGADRAVDGLSLGAWAERRQEFVDLIPEIGGEGRVIWTSRVSGAYSDPGRLRTDASVGIRLLDDRIPVSEAPGSTQRASGEATDALLLEWTGNLRTGPRTDLSWLYDARSERSATLQEIYIRTGQERGRYVWQDLNGDGATQIEEFIPETIPGEGEYVRTFLPSDSLTAVTSVTARLRLNRRAERDTDSRSGLLRAIGSETVLEVSEKSTTPDRSDVYLLQVGTFRDVDRTLNGRLRVRQQFMLRPGGPANEIRLTLQEARSLSRLAAGSESTRSSVAELFGRSRLAEGFSGRMTTALTVDSRSSVSFSTRTFDIAGVSAEPAADIRLTDRITITPGVFGAWKKDRGSDTTARIARLPVEALYQAGGSLRLTTRLEASVIRLDSDARGLTAFELTDGRGGGTSWLWNAGLRWLVNENLTATLVYDGRAPDSSPVIHTARFQLRAQF